MPELAGGNDGSLPRLKNFSDYHRELRDQIDPDTGERIQLLTRKQFDEALFKSLKDPSLKVRIKNDKRSRDAD